MSESNQTEQAENVTIYRVVRGSIRRPRGKTTRAFVNRGDFINQGELIPAGMFPAEDLASWLDQGRIAVAQVSQAQADEAAAIQSRGKWTVDPSTLVGKTMEDLLLMVLDIDPDFDADEIEDEQAAVRLLTSDWNPSYSQTVPPVSDRSRPQALALNKLEQTAEGGPATHSSTREPSPAASEAMAAARAKAQAPAEKAE